MLTGAPCGYQCTLKWDHFPALFQENTLTDQFQWATRWMFSAILLQPPLGFIHNFRRFEKPSPA